MANSTVLRSDSNGYRELPIDWNGPTTRAFVRFNPGDLNRPVAELFETVVRRNPSKIALDDGDLQLSYGEVWPLVQDLARRVAAHSAPGDLVGILLPTSTWCEIAILSCFLATRPFAPLDLHYPRPWIADVMGRAGMKTLIGRFDDEAASELIPSSVFRIDISTPLLGGDSATDTLCSALGPDEPAIVLFTSGSTGHPKGIVNSQRNLLRRVEQYIDAGHITAEDRFLPLSSACTIAGMRERLTALLSGATLHLVDVQQAGVRRLLEIIHHSGITVMWGLPALLRSMAQADTGGAPTSLRLVRLGGQAVLWSDISELRTWLSKHCLIQISYSCTEAPIMQWFVPPDFPDQGAKVPIGYPLAGNTIAILDDAGNPVLPGEVGELVVCSPYVALGLWMDGRCVRDQFPASAEDPASRVCRSGDLVRLRSDGLLDFIARKDGQIKIHGQRVELGELETALLGCEDVIEAAAVPRTVGDSVSLVAYVVLRGGGSSSLSAVAKSLKNILPTPLQPAHIFAIPAFPRLHCGKPDLQALAAFDRQYQRQELDSQAIAADHGPEASGLMEAPTSAEQAISAIWSTLLEKPAIGRHQDFFALGGDSLRALRLMFEIEKKFNVQLPLTMIHQCPTIACLARAVDEHVEPVFSPLVLIKDGSDGEPVFIVHGVGGTGMELFPLGRAIDWPGRIYAIQAQGLDGKTSANHTIEAMAECYLRAMRGIQPAGPYHLIGHSCGGLVAFEMARRFCADGNAVAFLGLLDTATSAPQWPLWVWAGQMYLRSWHHIPYLWRLSRREKIRHVGKVLISFRGHLYRRLGRRPQPPLPSYDALELPPALGNVRDAMFEATEKYSPPFYDGVLTLFRCSVRNPLNRCDPYLIWKGRARHLEVVDVPGSHRTMIEGENGRNLAQLVSACLAKNRRVNSELRSETLAAQAVLASEMAKRPVGAV